MKKVVDPAALARRLNELLKDRRVSQSELGRQIGVTQQTIANYASGKSTKGGRLGDIADGLGTSVKWLQYGQGPRDVAPPVIDPQEILRLVQRIEPRRRLEAVRLLRRLADDSEAA